MIWKTIGQSVIGLSHAQSGKGCEDAVLYQVIHAGTDEEALIGFVSDGAGSARYAAEAAQLAVNTGAATARDWLKGGQEINESLLLQLAETIYDDLNALAREQQVSLNDFSCTLLGFVILNNKACFMQIGDGAIVKNSGDDYFTPVWWPHNGEYQNTTAFLVDDANFRDLKIKVIEEHVTEVAVFTDGLQMLALNNEAESVHQPFFKDLFKVLRIANDAEHLVILNNKLIDYLSGSTINSRTDDDKTLLLATRFKE